jgi:hypothetical protein
MRTEPRITCCDECSGPQPNKKKSDLANSGGMDIAEGSSQSCTLHVFETRNNQIAAQRWARFGSVATVFILLITCVVLLASPSTTILGVSPPVKAHIKTGAVSTGINAGGIWIHDQFQPKKVWFQDSGSIHSPAEVAVAAARKQAMHVSTLIRARTGEFPVITYLRIFVCNFRPKRC